MAASRVPGVVAPFGEHRKPRHVGRSSLTFVGTERAICASALPWARGHRGVRHVTGVARSRCVGGLLATSILPELTTLRHVGAQVTRLGH